MKNISIFFLSFLGCLCWESVSASSLYRANTHHRNKSFFPDFISLVKLDNKSQFTTSTLTTQFIPSPPSPFSSSCPNKFEIEGIKQYFRGDFQQAVTSFQQAIKLDPYCASAYDGFGNALSAVGNIKKAIEAYRRSIELYNVNYGSDLAANPYSNLGMSLFEIGQWKASVEAFCNAIRLRPTSISYRQNLVNILSTQGIRVQKNDDIISFCKENYDIDISLKG